MHEVGLGIDRGRITIPIRDEVNALIGVLRYQPYETGRPKMLAVPGSCLGLVPHPTLEKSAHVMLVEGPPDMVAARSRGLPAVAVPDDHAWRDDWAHILAGRQVTVVMDADAAGRKAAARIENALADISDVRVHDLAPSREDGYDLTDWLMSPGALIDDDASGFFGLPGRSPYGDH
jgi:DNA primase